MPVLSHRDADKVSRRVADVLADVAALEILQAPGITFSIPDAFSQAPRLTGARVAPPPTSRAACFPSAPSCLLSYCGSR